MAGQQREHWRDLIYFLAGPALLTVLIAVAFNLNPWPVPIPAQADAFKPGPVAVILFLGAIGVALSSRAGLPSAPGLSERGRWRDLLLWSLAPGVAFGVVMFAVDAAFGIAANAANSIGATWVNVALPESIFHYAAGGVLVECLYRLIPIPILTWLISTVILRGRGQAQVFWTLAILTSLFEPATQAGLASAGVNAVLVAFMLLTFAANLFEAAHLKRHGWLGPILFRLAFYAVWHCFGPYLLPADSMFYPGPH